MSAPRIIQLRQLLKEKMPQLRVGFDELAARRADCWPTGIPQLDEPLQGGLPRGALSEIVATQRSAGSARLRDALLTHAAAERQIVALVDGRDSLDVTAMEAGVLERLLWVRCASADEAMKAADVLLRDRNVPLVIVDLMANPAAELRRIPATNWFRFQRILEQGSTVCVVLTPQARVSPAQARITIQARRRSLADLEVEGALVVGELMFDVSDARRLRETNQALENLA